MKKPMLIKIAVALCGITITILILFFLPLWGTAILLSFLSCTALRRPAVKQIKSAGITSPHRNHAHSARLSLRYNGYPSAIPAALPTKAAE